jgi:Tfp pilus assembly protein PilW
MMIKGYSIAGRTIAMIVGAILLVAAIVMFTRSCDNRRNQAAQERVEEGQANAASNSAADAIGTVAGAGDREAASEDLTRSNTRDIMNADGAKDPINPGLNAAGRRALCQREAYKNRPECRQ